MRATPPTKVSVDSDQSLVAGTAAPDWEADQVSTDGGSSCLRDFEHRGDTPMNYKSLSVSIDDLINTIIVTLDARDPYTYSHSERVAAVSVLIATEMGFSEEEIGKMHIAAHLHDIGKIGVTDLVLNKSGKLLREELVQMQSHSLIGYNIPNGIDIFKDIAAIVLHHHERFDGAGYPDNFKGEAIPLESRIIAVADSFDAITSDRTYRAGSSYKVGFEEINHHASDQFCPEVVKYFNRIQEKVPPLLDTIERVQIHHTAFVGHEDLIHSRRLLPQDAEPLS